MNSLFRPGHFYTTTITIHQSPTALLNYSVGYVVITQHTRFDRQHHTINMTKLSLSIALLLCLLPEAIVGFVPVTFQPRTVCRVATLPDQESVVDAAAGDDDTDEQDDDAEEETDVDFLFQIKQEVWSKLPQDEKVWRCVKKPLLRIGSKGATHAHGNSLRQLLEDHTVVKVKVNTKKFGTSLCVCVCVFFV